MVRKFANGDRVMARWPKSELYFNGTVVDFNDIQYLVRFDDEDSSEYPIRYADVRMPFSRSSRSRSRSRGRTPTRKSAARSPGRKSPARKTTSRSPTKASKSPARSPSKTTRMRKSTRSTADVLKEEVQKTVVTTTVTSKKVSVPVRQSARLQGTTAIDGKTNSIKVDTDVVSQKIQASKTFKGIFKRMVRGLWYNLVPVMSLLFVSLTPYLLMLMCTKKSCSLAVPELPKSLKSYLSLKAFYMSGGFFLGSFLLGRLPIGKVFKVNNGLSFRCNGYIGLLVVLAGIPLLVYQQINVVAVYPLFRQLLLCCQLIATTLAVILFIKSFYASKKDLNPEGSTGYYLADFLEGRQVAPAIFGFDFKMLIFRTSFLMMIVAQIVVFLKSFEASEKVNVTLSVAVALQVFFCVDLIIFEETLLTSYEYVKHGFGLVALLDYVSPPFVFTFYTRFIMNHGKEMPWYCLVGIIALHFIGYIISRGANCQKHTFKTNSSGPSVAHLETIAAGGGSRLLVSGWWGIVRHPNYLGDILVYLSWSFLCGFEFALPWIMFGLGAGYLIMRTLNVEADCKKKYGLAWTTYTARVPYRLIPKVF